MIKTIQRSTGETESLQPVFPKVFGGQSIFDLGIALLCFCLSGNRQKEPVNAMEAELKRYLFSILYNMFVSWLKRWLTTSNQVSSWLAAKEGQNHDFQIFAPTTCLGKKHVFFLCGQFGPFNIPNLGQAVHGHPVWLQASPSYGQIREWWWLTIEELKKSSGRL